MDTKLSESEAAGVVKALQQEFEKWQTGKCDVQKCQSMLTKLKLAMIGFNLTPKSSAELQQARAQLTIAREVLELGALVSVYAKDANAFQRYLTQVKVYYTDYGKALSESPRQWTILGLNLLHLLAHNLIAEFHTALELIPQQFQDKIEIKYPVQLEQWLMEGSYNKILSAGKTLASPHYSYFMSMLVDTVRDKISDCAEKSYDSLALLDARGLLMFDSDEAARKYTQKRKWDVRNNVIVFSKTSNEPADVPSDVLIRQSLEYATELERII